MNNRLRQHVAAALLLVPVGATFLSLPAAAQQRAVVAPEIASMTVNADNGLMPGSTLQFHMRATPNARTAAVALGGTSIAVPLRQTQPGEYRGAYTVRQADRIDATGVMTSRVTYGDRTVSRNFSYPPSFVALSMGAAPAAAPGGIERFVMRPQGRVEPGRELTFRLRGAPGGDAWLDIPGVIAGVDLSEVRPGVYEGSYTVRRRDNVAAFDNAVASLRSGNRTLTARLDRSDRDDDDRRDDRRAGGRDDRAPTITNLVPANGDRISERGRVHIAAHLADEGSGIDPASVRMRINGREVSEDLRLSPEGELRYRDNLPPGRHTIEVTVRDQARNTTTKSWAFDVVEGERGAGGPLPLQVTSHSNGAVVDANGNLVIAGRTIPNGSVRVQVDAVASVFGALGVTQPLMDQTVEADRNGNFNVSLRPRTLPLPGTRFDVRLSVQSGNQTAEERITLHQRQG